VVPTPRCASKENKSNQRANLSGSREIHWNLHSINELDGHSSADNACTPRVDGCIRTHSVLAGVQLHANRAAQKPRCFAVVDTNTGEALLPPPLKKGDRGGFALA
jgi:hypothetical protein